MTFFFALQFFLRIYSRLWKIFAYLTTVAKEHLPLENINQKKTSAVSWTYFPPWLGDRVTAEDLPLGPKSGGFLIWISKSRENTCFCLQILRTRSFVYICQTTFLLLSAELTTKLWLTVKTLAVGKINGEWPKNRRWITGKFQNTNLNLCWVTAELLPLNI